MTSRRLSVLLLAFLPGAAWADLVPLRLDAPLDSGLATMQFDAGEVASATVETDADGSRVLRIKVALDRRPDLELFSTDALGGEVVVAVCGEEMARATLLSPIPDGVLVLRDVEPEATRRAAAQLTDAAPCGPAP